MKPHWVEIRSIKLITHDVLQIVTDRPKNYDFMPGQATEIAINKKGWELEKRPFTFTSCPFNDYLEFTIKTYPLHKGVTGELMFLKVSDILILHEVFGSITYKGQGLFIAAGAGITPFISILRELQALQEIGDNQLIFANKTAKDIIIAGELNAMLGNNFINILSDENDPNMHHGLITEEFLTPYMKDVNKRIYLCGPPLMMESTEKILIHLGVSENSIIKEIF